MPLSNRLVLTPPQSPMASPFLAMENICTLASPTPEPPSLPFLTVTPRNSSAGLRTQGSRVSPRKSRTPTKPNSSSALQIVASALSTQHRHQLCLRRLPSLLPRRVFSRPKVHSLAELLSLFPGRTSLLSLN